MGGESVTTLAPWPLVQLEYEYQEEFTPENMQTNIILATFTTAHARLRLFNVLHRLGESVSKNYGYKLENGKCFCKIKGFTLNHLVSQKLNFEKNERGSTTLVQ